MFRWIRPVALFLLASPACGQRFDCSHLAIPGSLAVAVRDVDVPDAGRGFSVRARLFTPDPVGPHTALILLSPGLGPLLADFDPLARTLATSDYAVAVIEHRASTTAHVCGEKLQGLDCWNALQETEVHAENWDDRFSDLLLLMDRLPAQLGIDGTHIGLIGHSFGAFNSMALGGTTYVDPRSKERRDRRDPRVVSVIAMSPQGPRWFGLDQESWKHIDRPLYLMTGDHDGSTMVDDSPEWRREPFAEMSGGDKLMLRIADGDHMSFTARARRHEIADLVERSALAFMDATMRKHDLASTLDPEAVKACSRGQASIERR